MNEINVYSTAALALVSVKHPGGDVPRGPPRGNQGGTGWFGLDGGLLEVLACGSASSSFTSPLVRLLRTRGLGTWEAKGGLCLFTCC